MRKIIFSIMLALLPLTTTPAELRYQLPEVTICGAHSGCAIAIDENGFLRDSTSHEMIFDQPFRKTVFDSYLVLKSKGLYIVERSNTTSSKNWDVLLLTYVGGAARAERAVSLSRGVAMNTPTVYWSGYECRGDALMDRQYSPFDAAKKALCGRGYQSDSLSLEKSAVIEAAKKRGLVVNIPVYGLASKKNAIYFFPGDDEPDAGALLCLQNCKPGQAAFGRYGGWVDKTLWIDGVLHNSENLGALTGSYFYIGKKEKINLAGSYLAGKLSLRESFPVEAGVTQEQTAFEGNGSSDAFVGKWYSVVSGKTYEFFMASRIY
ncbi:hypothetical protein [Paraburkholderia phenazinium]|jgi:hypothetical protein|uniref:DKNYY family protein n=1 Tax=Paraburkholderia phenazinium TaxID=60549 RepID=A0A1N6GDV0_9BURK|nr:hypothetical protein [Paraburkholderia phenazinium]SIO05715.1 hypothetical protein SAMN05444168_2322 [Paraburkholderia phenazinium]